MATFLYKALTNDGRMTEGRLDVGGRTEALRQLESLGLQPVRLDESAGAKAAAAKGEGAGLNFSFGAKKVTHKQVQNFMRQLSSLLAGGVPLARALQILTRGAQGVAQDQWKQIHDMVIDGTPLADAMGRLPQTFPRVYVAMVRAGETGGFLDVVLTQIAEFQAREKELKGKVKSAMIYPAVLLGMAVCVLIFLLTFFIPRFQLMFSNMGGDLPLVTKLVIGASHIMTHYGPFVLIFLGVAGYLIRQWLQSEKGRRQWDTTVLKLPVVGPLASRFAMTRFCRMLGTLTKSGVGLIQGLRVARDSIGNMTLVDAVGEAIERVQKGDSLAASLGDCPALFPGTAIEMISVAEESGRLDSELIRLSDETEKELDGELRTAVALAEPALLFMIAAFIGIIFIAMVLPIFSSADLVK